MRIEEVMLMFDTALSDIYPDPHEREMICMLSLEVFLGPLNRMSLHLRKTEELNESRLAFINKMLVELKNHRPVQYVIGKAEFYGLEFYVNEHVLIPRQETEELVNWIIEDVKSSEFMKGPRILDLGTGSGCIAISLKVLLEDSCVDAIDISSSAIEVAKKNAIRNHAEVNFRLNDILNEENRGLSSDYDIFVSNPPYIRHSEKGVMRPNVLDFEPHSALFVDDEDPLIFYNRIADMGIIHLKVPGLLYFEINEALGIELISMLEMKNYSDIQIRSDLHGKARMLKATRPQ
jgi:release factor glutamine methyltransferase